MEQNVSQTHSVYKRMNNAKAASSNYPNINCTHSRINPMNQIIYLATAIIYIIIGIIYIHMYAAIGNESSKHNQIKFAYRKRESTYLDIFNPFLRIFFL